MRVSFEQATIKIEKQEDFARLQGVVEQAFAPGNAEKFLKQLDHRDVRVRDFDGVLAARCLEDVAGSAKDLNAGQLYQALPVSDQAQMRELYLSKLESVSDALRHKFKKLYQYY